MRNYISFLFTSLLSPDRIFFCFFLARMLDFRYIYITTYPEKEENFLGGEGGGDF